MGKYDFTSLPNRFGHHTYKWKEAEADREILPAWIADMDFVVLPEVRQAVQAYADQLVYGYTYASDALIQSVQDWEENQHGYTFDKEALVFIEGVVPAISTAIQAFTKEGEAVLINTPVYPPFARSVKLNNRRLITNSLVEKDGLFEIDFDQLEKELVGEDVKLYILCNPHNPVGRVWTNDELALMNAICMRHNVKVISDEIHCELIMPGYTFSPFAAVSSDCLKNSVICNSPTKNFNIAGLQIANIICDNKEWRRRIDRIINIFEVCDVNPFGPIALEAAYNESEEWLNQLIPHIAGNYALLKETFKKQLPNYGVMKLEGTYLVWVDIRKSGLNADELAEKLLRDGKVQVNSGMMYGKTAGEDYIRINIACPRAILQEGLNRIVKVLTHL